MTNNDLILEAYPSALLAKIEQREREKRLNVPSYVNGHARELVFEDLKLWRVGKLQVSFKGGDTTLHRKIAKVAEEWTKFGNIQFDFREKSDKGSFRKWHANDSSHIRVGFQYNGYWSLVGTDSMDTAIVQPGEITLNLDNFDEELPDDWEKTVLHEFGHALGFLHEHQTTELLCDFNWPLVYDRLAGPPNFWPKAKVDHNMRQLMQGGITTSAHDKNSIMHYSFPSWMFLSGTSSKCFTDGNNTLSDTDKAMMARAYPYDQESWTKLDLERVKNLETLIGFSKDSPKVIATHKEHLDFYKGIK